LILFVALLGTALKHRYCIVNLRSCPKTPKPQNPKTPWLLFIIIICIQIVIVQTHTKCSWSRSNLPLSLLKQIVSGRPLTPHDARLPRLDSPTGIMFKAHSRAKRGDPVHLVGSLNSVHRENSNLLLSASTFWGNWGQFSLQQGLLTTYIIRDAAMVLEVSVDHFKLVWKPQCKKGGNLGQLRAHVESWRSWKPASFLCTAIMYILRYFIIALFRAESQLAAVTPQSLSIRYFVATV